MASLIPMTVLNFARFLLSSRLLFPPPPLLSSSFSPLTPTSSLADRRYPSLHSALRVAYRIEENQQFKGTPEGWFSNSFARRFQWIHPPRRINKPRRTRVELLSVDNIDILLGIFNTRQNKVYPIPLPFISLQYMYCNKHLLYNASSIYF